MRAVSPTSTIRSASSWKSATSNLSFKSAESDLKRQLSKKLGAQAKKSPQKSGANKQRKRKQKSNVNMSRYILKVLRSVAPEQEITKKSMAIMDNFMMDIYDKITSQLPGLVKFRKGRTVTSADIQTATKLILPGELAVHAVSNGVNALAHYFKNTD